ncbi:MAG: hypothetical protein DME32_05065, partial [Verrucomicrobia bacterium]
FHIWVADVYQGAPTPVTAFLSVGSKAAGFIVLLRVLEPFLILPQMQTLLVAIAVLTLIYGNLAALPLLVLVSQPGGDQLESFAGLSQRSPFLAFAMLVAMASLAGVPFTAGFLGKFLVFDAAIATHHFGLVVVAIVTVGAGFYYYFKVVRAIYWDAPASSTDKIIVSPLTRAALIALIAGTFVLGVYPQPIFDALR